MLHATPITDRDTWNSALRALPFAHVLQSWEWGEFKRRETGWRPERLLFADERGSAVAAASVLTRRVGPLRVMYVPKGPAAHPDHLPEVLAHLESLARRRRAIWLKIDPDVIEGTGIPGSTDHPAQDDPTGTALVALLRQRKWRFSASQVQFRNTMTLDLAQSEDAIMAGMNQSTRRKLRMALKQDVITRLASGPADFQTLYDLYRTTGERQGFLIRPPDYYHDAWTRFFEAGLAAAFLAEWQGRALAGLVLYRFGPKAWYFYGMSADAERDRMPTYMLQWEAMRWAKAQGCTTYDFWGAPDRFEESDPMWGVFRFKEGFGGKVVRHIGAWDYAPYPLLYTLYERLMPRVIGIMRRRWRRSKPAPTN